MNRAKRKGDRYELEAVGVLAGLLPALTVAKPQRMLGAGRRDDKGDLLVLADTAVQVKAWRDTVRAVTDAASGAHRQAAGWDLPYSVGMVPVLGASRFAVRWLFATHQWPTGAASRPGGHRRADPPRRSGSCATRGAAWTVTGGSSSSTGSGCRRCTSPPRRRGQPPTATPTPRRFGPFVSPRPPDAGQREPRGRAGRAGRAPAPAHRALPKGRPGPYRRLHRRRGRRQPARHRRHRPRHPRRHVAVRARRHQRRHQTHPGHRGLPGGRQPPPPRHHDGARRHRPRRTRTPPATGARPRRPST